MKRIISIVLTIIVTISSMPINSFAVIEQHKTIVDNFSEIQKESAKLNTVKFVDESASEIENCNGEEIYENDHIYDSTYHNHFDNCSPAIELASIFDDNSENFLPELQQEINTDEIIKTTPLEKSEDDCVYEAEYSIDKSELNLKDIDNEYIEAADVDITDGKMTDDVNTATVESDLEESADVLSDPVLQEQKNDSEEQEAIDGCETVVYEKEDTVSDSKVMLMSSVLTNNYPETEHPFKLEWYDSGYKQYYYRYSYTYPKATDGLKVKFSSQTKVGTNDTIRVYSSTPGNSKEIGRYSSDELAGKELVVAGNSLTIYVYSSNSSSSYYGFSIVSITPMTSHTVTFRNYDGTEISTTNVLDGETAIYSGVAPIKERQGNVAYDFEGWDVSLENVVSDLTATAVFREKTIYLESDHPLPTYETKKYVYAHGSDTNALRITFGQSTAMGYYGSLSVYDEYNNQIFNKSRYSADSVAGNTVDIAGNSFTIETYTSSSGTYGFEITNIEPLDTPVHTVVFKNDDGLILETNKILDGADAKYNGYTPTKKGDNDHAYNFIGWDKELTNITEDSVFTAIYEAYGLHTVTFKNYDGTILDEQNVADGENVYYYGTEPTKPKDQQYVYIFTGWDKELKNVTENLIVTAQFEACEFHTVTYKNYNGTVLAEEYVADGYRAELMWPGEMLSIKKDRDDQHIYKFSSWDVDLSCVTEDITATALFDAYEYYTVTYVNYDGTVLYEDYVDKKRGYSSYKGKIPFRPHNDETGYIFNGWSENVSSWDSVKGNMTIVAQFDEVPIFHIYSEDGLKRIYELMPEISGSKTTGYFILENDIELTEPWIPFDYFSGVFLGQNHKITNVIIKEDNSDSNDKKSGVGFFNYITNAVVKDLFLIISYDMNDVGEVGGFANEITNASIENCHTNGNISFITDGIEGVYGQAGGFAASVRYGAFIEKCSADVNIYTNSGASGFVGWIEGGQVFDCFSTGKITVNNRFGAYNLYGFTGQTWINEGVCVERAYSSVETEIIDTGVYEVTAPSTAVAYNLGEISGFAPTREKEYKNDVTIIIYSKNNYCNDCYYNSSLFSAEENCKTDAKPLIASKMKIKSNFNNYDFDNVWNIKTDVNSGYPYIKSIDYFNCDGHVFGDWMVTHEPENCSEKQEWYRECKKCGYFETKHIQSIQHLYSDEWTITTDPTCERCGYNSHICTVCGAIVESVEIPALGHKYSEEWQVRSYRINGLYQLYHKCTVCEKESEDVPAIKCGDNAYGIFDKENATIYIIGSGDVNSINVSSALVEGETVERIVVEDGITYLNCQITGSDVKNSLKEIQISPTVTQLNQYIFRNFTNIEEIYIPGSISVIQSYAFQGCSSLKTVTFGEGVKKIGDYLFQQCPNIESVYIPKSVSDISTNAFYYGNTSTIKGYSGSYAEVFAKIKNISFESVGECEEIINSGSCGYDVGYELYGNGILRIVGSGNMTDYSYNTAPWNSYSTIITSVRVDDGVTYIGKYSFSNFEKLTDVSISNTVTGIGESAFYRCIGLTSVTIPNSVTSIGDDAFCGCSGLRSIVLPDSVKSIGYYAFGGCGSLKSITIPGSVTDFGTYIFEDAGLVSVTIEDGITSIEDGSFYRCEDLTSIVIPSSVTVIQDSAFYYCNNLKNVFFNGTQEQWQSITIESYNNPLSYAKINCISADKIVIFETSGGMVSPDYKAIEIGSTYGELPIATKEGCVFDGWYTELYGGERVTSDTIITSEQNHLLYAHWIIQGTCGDELIWSLDNDGMLTITGIGEMSNYSSSNVPWYDYRSNIKEINIETGVTSIGNYAFYDCEELTKIIIPNSVTNIGDFAFADCGKLTGITIPDSVAEIKNYAFGGCGGLTSITIPNSVTKIGEFAFSRCRNLTDIIIPDSVTSIGNNAFDECSELKNVYITNLATWCEIEFSSPVSNPLYYAKKLYIDDNLITDLVVPDGVTSIGKYAFYNCQNLARITLPDSITNIGDSAFSNCKNLAGIEMPDNVTSIGYSTFSDCEMLTSIVLPNGLTNIGDSAFSNCKNLASIEIPDNVTSIGDNAFSGCAALTSVALPNGLTTINYSTFCNCSELTSIYIPDSVTGVMSNAFTGCEKLANIYVDSLNAWWSGSLSSSIFLSYSESSEKRLYNKGNEAKEITIPEGITEIKKELFNYFTNIQTMTIPKDVIKITALPESIKKVVGYEGSVAETYAKNNDITFETLGSVPVEIILSAKCGTNAEYCLYSDGLLKISGTGSTRSYYSSSLPAWSKYYVTNVVVDEGITQLGDYSFYNCDAIKSVKLPNSLTTIGSYAFYNCDELKNIEFGNELTTIGSYAFYDCDEITDVPFRDKVGNIYSYAFYDCDNIMGIEFLQTTVQIQDYAFYSCDNLKNITFAEGSVSIASNALKKCNDLTICGYNGTNPQTYATNNKIPFVNLGTHEHTYDEEWTIDTAPTCTQSGYKSLYCTVCKKRINVVTIPALGHDFEEEWHIDKQPTCVSAGIKSQHCQRCGKTINSVEIEPLGHDYGDEWITDVEATCLSDGSKSHHCSRCGDRTDITVVEKLGHNFGEWVVSNPATCASNGERYHICDRCNYKEINVLIALGHDYSEEWTVDVEPTCTEEGSKSHHCLRCDDKSDITIVEALGHDYTEWETRTAPTCTTDGLEFRTCQRIDCGHEETNILLALGHDFATEWTIDKEPTCTEKGSKSHHCSRCNEQSDMTEIEPLGHDYTDWQTRIAPTCTTDGLEFRTCQRTDCGHEETSILTALGHDYSEEWTVDVEPTCTKEGSKSHHCSRCDDKSDITIVEALGHDYTEWETRTAPTCTTDGLEFRTCQRIDCGHEETNILLALGHDFATEWTIDKEPTCTEKGSKSHHCSRCNEQSEITEIEALGHIYGEWIERIPATCVEDGEEYRVCERCNQEETNVLPAHGHDFSEWEINAQATVFSEGEKSRKCKVCQEVETEKIEKISVGANDEHFGTANFKIVDAQSLEPIKNAVIYISTLNYGEGTVVSDESGNISCTLPAEKINLTVFANDYQQRKLTINVVHGNNNIPEIGLSQRDPIRSELKHHEMTYDEIIAAGIDPTAEGNNHVYKYELKLGFHPEIDMESIIAYFNGLGDFLGFGDGAGTGGGHGDGAGTGGGHGDGAGTQTYYLHYHVGCAGWCCWGWCKTVESTKGSTLRLDYVPKLPDDPAYAGWRFDGWYSDIWYTKRVYEVKIEDHCNPVYGRWIIPSSSGEYNNPNGWGKGYRLKDKLTDETIEVYPVSERFYIIVRGEVHWLKEMFDVELLVFNDSNTDTVEDSVATLTLPAGLSLATMKPSIGQQTFAQEIPFIDKGKSESVHWYVRGDKEGTYDIFATLKGKTMPFEEEFEYKYAANEPIKVYAGSAMRMTFTVPEATFYNDDYRILIELENVSDRTLYNVTHSILELKQGKVVQYSDGTTNETVYVDEHNLGEISTKEFKPGDKIVVELTTNIMFESELMEYRLDKLVGFVDDVEKFVSAYNAVKTGLDMASAVLGFVGGASHALSNIISGTSITDMDKLKATKGLAGAISGLMGKIKGGNSSKAVKYANKIKGTSVYKTVMEIAQDENWVEAHTALDIYNATKSVLAMCEEEENNEELSAFDSLRLAIESIPIKFILDETLVTTLEGSTTEIPYSIRKTKVGARYFGVENVSKYMYSLANKTIGEVSLPWYCDLMDLNDPTGAKKSAEYVKSVENEIQKFAAKDATGETTFQAWIEPNLNNLMSIKNNTKLMSENSDFELSTTNETATYENAILYFTGAGYIDVKPLNKNGGILHILMNGEEEKIFVIDVVDKHTCNGNEWSTIVEPSKDFDGYAVKYCDICGDIMDIKTVKCCEHHNYDEFVVENELSETMNGIKKRVCKDCGHTQYVFITEDGEVTLKLTNESLLSFDEDDGYLMGVAEKLTASQLKSNFDNENVIIRNQKGDIVDESARIGTGFIIQLTEGDETIDECTVVVKGDTSGDGKVNVSDLIGMFNHVQGTNELSGAYYKAAMINSDAKVNVSDLVALFNLIQN